MLLHFARVNWVLQHHLHGHTETLVTDAHVLNSLLCALLHEGLELLSRLANPLCVVLPIRFPVSLQSKFHKFFFLRFEFLLCHS